MYFTLSFAVLLLSPCRTSAAFLPTAIFYMLSFTYISLSLDIHTHSVSFPVSVLYTPISLLFVSQTPCLLLEIYLLCLFVCFWITMTSWEFRILVKAQTYIVKTFNLVCCFLIFMPTVALLSEKAILQNFQISCKMSVCGFR